MNLTPLQDRIARFIGTHFETKSPPFYGYAPNYLDNSYDNPLSYFGWNADATLEDMFLPGGDAYKAMETLIGEEQTVVARKLWLRGLDCTITPRYLDSSPGIPMYLRSARTTPHVLQNIVVLCNFAGGVTNGFTVESYPQNWEQTVAGHDLFVPPLLGMLLDEGGTEADRLFDGICAVLRSNPDRALRDRNFRGVLLASTREDVHKILTDALIGKPLDEKVRMGVLEDANRWSLDAFMRVQAAINEEGGIRSLSSFIDAVCNWTGFSRTVIGAEMIKSAFELSEIPADRSDPAALLRPDVHQPHFPYMGLWTLGMCKGVECAVDAAQELLRSRERPYKISALYYARHLNNATLQLRIVAAFLEDPKNFTDRFLVALAAGCFRTVKWVRLAEAENTMPFEGEEQALVATPEEIRRLFGMLLALAESFPPHTDSCGGREFIEGYVEAGCSIWDIVGLMKLLAGVSPDTASEKEFRTFMKKLGQEQNIPDKFRI